MSSVARLAQHSEGGEMIDYEIWGPDDHGDHVNLGTGTGEVPGEVAP